MGLPSRDRRVPKSTKIQLWLKYFKKFEGRYKCRCCKTEIITYKNWHAGHVRSKHHGGSNHIRNLRPICGHCNTSMGTKHMIAYIAKYHPSQKVKELTAMWTRGFNTIADAIINGTTVIVLE